MRKSGSDTCASCIICFTLWKQRGWVRSISMACTCLWYFALIVIVNKYKCLIKALQNYQVTWNGDTFKKEKVPSRDTSNVSINVTARRANPGIFAVAFWFRIKHNWTATSWTWTTLLRPHKPRFLNTAHVPTSHCISICALQIQHL